jgi:hypothetical protein
MAPIVDDFLHSHDADARAGHHDARLITMFLGEDLLAWLVLALGGALFVGNLLAVLRPPERTPESNDLARAPVGRSLVMAAVGLVAGLWALVSLVSG